LILSAGAVVRLLLWWVFRHQELHISDELDYQALAENLVNHGEYAFGPGKTPTSLRPPLYPFLLAGFYWLAGPGYLAAVRLFQAVVSLGTVAITYRLGREVVAPRTATWAAGLLCFYPSLLAYNNLILTEVVFTFLLTAAVLLTVLAIRRGSVGCAAAAGVVLGLAALTRSIVWLAPPFLAAYFLIVWPAGWGRRLAAAAALAAAFAAVLAPWSVRNTRLQQTFVAVDTMGGLNFMLGNYRHTPLYRSWDAITLEGEKFWAHEVITTYPPEERVTQGQMDKLALRQGLKFVRENPGLTLQRDLVKFFDFWGLEREVVAGAGRGFFGTPSRWAILGLTAAIAGGYAAAILLAIFGVLFAPPADRRAHWLFLAVIAYTCALHTVVFAHSRYHLPLVPLILLYTAGAVTHAGAIWRRRWTGRFWAAAGLCGGLAAGWAWSFVAVDWELFARALRSAG
jgi:hypothetical protein